MALEGAGLGNGVSEQLDPEFGNCVSCGRKWLKFGRQGNARAGFVIGEFPKTGIVKSIRALSQ